MALPKIRVASIILIQPKNRNRSRLIEKMMNVATCLRGMDAYDPLMGILAGLNAQPVFRLNDSLDPIHSKGSFKKFRINNRLMSTSKSFAAYRLALSTASGLRIPYLYGSFLHDPLWLPC
jgi:hypothetical protein